MQKKGQAALEFLTTYAWAFVVILVMIGALAYFGVLKPQKLLPDRCVFNAGFDCQAAAIDNNGTMNIKVKNNLGKVITITTIDLTLEDGSAYGGCALSGSLPVNWVSENTTTLSWASCQAANAGFVRGEKAKVNVQIDYYDGRAGATFAQIAQGEIFTTVT